MKAKFRPRNVFNSEAVKVPQRNWQDLSHTVNLSAKMGRLVPHCVPVVPGDRHRVLLGDVIRFAPMAAPCYQQFKFYAHAFFVPDLIVWSGSDDFHTGNAPTTFPTVDLDNVAIGSIPDFLGIRPNNYGDTGGKVTVSAIPFAGYAAIWDEWYRDEVLQTALDIDLADGDNTAAIAAAGLFGDCFNRSYEKDYFTAAAPSPQRGPDVFLPLGSTAPLVNVHPSQASVVLPVTGGTAPVGNIFTDGSHLTDTNGIDQNVDVTGHTEVDLSSATSSTINTIRRAWSLQRYYERLARVGTRIKEWTLGVFGVDTGDARIQIPQYLGGTAHPVSISEVLQTSSTDRTSPLGEMAGHGIGTGTGVLFDQTFSQHGYLFFIVSVIPNASYMQGIQRHFFKFDPFDYIIPDLAHIGEQEILNQELFAQGNAFDKGVFGYIPRYSEYRWIPNTCHGDFTDTLDIWTLARKFSTLPMLNEEFIEVRNVETDRIFALTDPKWDKLYITLYFKWDAWRKLPKYGNPI